MEGEHERRCVAAQREMAARGVDYLVATPSSDMIYLAGIAAEPSERLLALILPASGPPTLVLPRLEAGKLAETATFALRAVWEETEDPVSLVARLVAGGAGGRPVVAVGDQTWASTLLAMQKAMPLASFVPAGPLLSTLRVIKSPAEVALLREAARRADAAWARILAEPLLGKSEAEVASLVSSYLVEAGLAKVSFCIVGSGPNSAKPHHEPGARRLAAGDAVVFDYGGTFAHYQSDITRTLFIGQPSERQRAVYEAVATAQEAAFRSIRPGVTAGEVDAVARGRLRAAGLGQYFIHRTGHGLGLDVHEEPYIVSGSELPLREGMVFSVEPGAYLPGEFGVRLEDIVVVTATGAERLNQAPRALAVATT